ncbi:MAG: hypothetical protein B6229_04735 [Spirochaetaceae bacterium 4572_7]|nr:MAG: hypothetical protein B6229_04735 [Spirochaetaceae bacterium 4572_7]
MDTLRLNSKIHGDIDFDDCLFQLKDHCPKCNEPIILEIRNGIIFNVFNSLKTPNYIEGTFGEVYTIIDN